MPHYGRNDDGVIGIFTFNLDPETSFLHASVLLKLLSEPVEDRDAEAFGVDRRGGRYTTRAVCMTACGRSTAHA